MSDILSHYACQHACDRAAQRLGFVPTLEHWRTAVLTILDTLASQPRALLLRRYDANELWMVSLNGNSVKVIWCPQRAIIVTVLA